MTFPAARPTILGTVTTPAGLRQLARQSIPAHAIEVRVDALLAQKVPVETIETALKARKHPALITLRIPAEGGHRRWKPTERRDLYLRLLPHAEAIDIEIATASALAPVIAEARRTRKTVILSAHALKRPATPAQIAAWTAPFDPPPPRTILKIAAQIKSWRHLQQLAALLVNHPAWPIAVMGLGLHAAQSRRVLAALGSRLVYGYLDEPAAPGQPSAAEVRKMIDDIAP
jgi:3-dehydroquinate dehydratase I